MNTEKQKKNLKPLPSKAYLEECFTYDPETGLLYWKERPSSHFKTQRAWKIWNSKYPGELALNSPSSTGYLRGALDSRPLKAHRVIWKLWYGSEPETILHSNGNKTDNRIEKLSTGTQRENCLDQSKRINNKSGITGVYWNTRSEKWHVQIGDKSTSIHIGYFQNLEDAVAARKAAEVQYGYHPNHGVRQNAQAIRK